MQSFQNFCILRCLVIKLNIHQYTADKTINIWIGDLAKRWNLSQYNLTWSEKPIKYLGHFIFTDNKEALKIEWTSKIAKLRNILDSWKKRNLSIFGRVTVLKSLALSQIIHAIIVDSIPKDILCKLNRMVYEFIWGSKVERVKRSILIGDYVDGGIKMIDIEKQMLSFRLKWLGRLLDGNTGIWKEMAHFWFKKLGGIKLLLNCNYDNEIIMNITEKKIPIFYGEILNAWMSVRLHANTKSKTAIENNFEQILWHNQHVTHEKRSIYYGYWFESGIFCLKDIMENNRLMTMTRISCKLKPHKRKSNLMFDYAKLKQALPKVWINQTINNNTQIFPEMQSHELQIPTIFIRKKNKAIYDLSSKDFYSLIILTCKSQFTNPCCLFWDNKVNNEIVWSKVFKRYLIHIKENKLRQFNFKFLYNLLPVKKNLLKWRLVNNANCSHCNIEEDVIHAFITCKLNVSFFKHVKFIIEKIFKERIDFDYKLLFKSDPDDYDLVVIIALWCVYVSILDRNKTGKDRRNINLRFFFAREIEKRMEINIASNKETDELPREILYYL